MRKFRITIVCNFIFFLAFGLQAQTLQWAKSIGGIGVDEGNSVAIDAAGNVYSIGRFQGTVDFDPGDGISNQTSAGSYDIYILKLDADGEFLWVKTIGSINYDIGNSITVDNSGNIYAAGQFESTVDFDPSAGTSIHSSLGGSDVFILKLDELGNLIWSKAVGSTANNSGKSISVDTFGNVYTTGDFGGTVDFDPGTPSFYQSAAEGSGVFIQKLDAQGEFLWAKTFWNPNYNFGYAIALDPNGNVYATGAFQGTIDFDPGVGIYNLISAGDNDIFIQKLNASGDFLWAKTIGGPLNDIGWSLVIDNYENVFTTGYFGGTVDFNPDLTETFNITSVGSVDCFIQKMDASGNFVWAKTYGGILADIPSSIALDNQGNIYSIGRFQGTADFNPGIGTDSISSLGERDIFIQKLTADGNFEWAKSFGGIGIDGAASITIDAEGNIYSTGYFYGSADFNPDLLGNQLYLSNGERDIYVQKLSSTPISIAENNFGALFSVYPNPTNNKITIDLGDELRDVTVVLRNLLGQEITRRTFYSTLQINMVIEEPQGLYFLELKSDTNRALIKIVKH